ncbi:MAG: DDE-type integrase/transposase/recombinase [Candidatus Bathyarchaeia archaeon]
MQTCKYCQSDQTVKHGMRAGIQRYLCKNCHHHFYDNAIAFPRMRVDSQVIITSLNMYYGGLSTRKVAEQISNIFGEHISQTTVWYWIHQYSTLVSEYVETLKPTLSGKYHHDETEIVVGGQGRYFWETIDEDTRFIVAHLLTESRTSEDAKTVFRKALAVQKPKILYTDGSFAYDDAYNKVFYSRYKEERVEWVRRVGIKCRKTNNVVERLHGTLKDRTKPMRGLKNDTKAESLLNGYVINYNYCRKHQSIGKTPAEAAGVSVKGWKQLIQAATVQKSGENPVEEKQLMEEVIVR